MPKKKKHPKDMTSDEAMRHFSSSANFCTSSTKFISSIGHLMPKKKKHPKDMTSDEAMKHLFSSKGHRLIKKHAAKLEKEASTKKA